MDKGKRLLVVSHPSVLPVNQLVYGELARRGWQLKLIVPSRWHHEYHPSFFRPTPLVGLENNYEPLPTFLPGKPQRHFYLVNPLKIIGKWQPTVSFLEQEPFSMAGAQWAAAFQRYGIPFGIQYAETLDRRLPWPARIAHRYVLPRAAFVAARSPTAKKLAEARRAGGRVAVVPHHVPDWEHPHRPQRDDFTVGFVGRLVPEKGIDTLVEAIKALPYKTQLIIAGDGPLRSWLETADLGLASVRLLTGLNHSEMGHIYTQMDLLVLPSRTTRTWSEQFGRVLVEALWCGTPVIGSDSGEIPWVVRTTGGGLVFPEGDSLALTGMINAFRANPSIGKAFAAKGQHRVKDLFSVPAVADSLENALETAGTKSGRTGRGPSQA